VASPLSDDPPRLSEGELQDGDDDLWEGLIVVTTWRDLRHNPFFRRTIGLRRSGAASGLGGMGLLHHPLLFPTVVALALAAAIGPLLAGNPLHLALIAAAGFAALMFTHRVLARRLLRRPEARQAIIALALSPDARPDLALGFLYPYVLGERLAAALFLLALAPAFHPILLAAFPFALWRAFSRPLLTAPQMAQFLDPVAWRAARRIAGRVAGTVLFWSVIIGYFVVVATLFSPLLRGGPPVLALFTFLIMMLVGVLGALRYAARLREFRAFLDEYGSYGALFDAFLDEP
jgi:hypothetical protein